MLLALTVSTLASTLAVSTLPVAADADSFAKAATDWLLAGEELPTDYLQQLAAMPPDQRLLAIVFLRRAGLLDGAPIPISTLLAPVAADGDAAVPPPVPSTPAPSAPAAGVQPESGGPDDARPRPKGDR